MDFSFNGFHQEIATFRAAEGVAMGSLVMLSGSAEVSPAADGKDFIGVCVSLRGNLVGIQLCGAATLAYTGTSPAVGRCGLTAAGGNKIKTVAGGEKHIVLAVDESKQTCVVLL